MSVTADIRDDELANLVVIGDTVAECAAKLGVSTSTIYRRMGTPSFRAKLASVRAQQWLPAANRLRRSFDRAMETLEELAANSESEGVRLRASEAIAKLALDLKRITGTDEQLASMAQQLAANADDEYTLDDTDTVDTETTDRDDTVTE